MFQQDNKLGKSIKDKSKSSTGTYKVTISLYMKHFYATQTNFLLRISN